jgi:uncharacterized membrane protein HdeD (DUF308 family)
MAKNPIGRFDVWGIIFVVSILIGIGLLPSLFLKIDVLGFIGIFLLTFGAVGIIIFRRKVSALKRSNPEFFRALEAEDSASNTKCPVCSADVGFYFRCYYCKKYFCEKHILPENHHCSMAPKASFRTVLLTCSLMVFAGIIVLYVSLMPSLSWVFALGGFLIGMGLILLIGRAWEERQSKRAIGLN